MALAARVGVDTVGGGLIQLPGTQPVVRLNSSPMARVGDSVAPHPPFGPHNIATLSSGSAFVRIRGIAVCRHGDLATCGDTVTVLVGTVRVTG